MAHQGDLIGVMLDNQKNKQGCLVWVCTKDKLPPDVGKQYLMVKRCPWVQGDTIFDDVKLKYDIVGVNFGQGAHNFPDDFPYWAELPGLPDNPDIIFPSWVE